MNISLNLSVGNIEQLDAILNTLEQRGLLEISPVTNKAIVPSVSVLKKSPIELEYNKAFGTFRLTKQESELIISGQYTRDQVIQVRLDCTTTSTPQEQEQEQEDDFAPLIDVPSKGLF